MRPFTVFGIVLLAIGLLAWAYCGIIYATAPDPGVRFGPTAMILTVCPESLENPNFLSFEEVSPRKRIRGAEQCASPTRPT